MHYAECTTSRNGRRTRQPCGFCLPVPQEVTGTPDFWRVDRAEYDTLRGNTPSRFLAVVETRRPLPRAVTTKLACPSMNHSIDRDALARRVFDDVICSSHSDAIHALNDWCRMIAGLGGYLGCTANSIDSSMPPLEEHLSGTGFLIEKAAKIAVLLAEQVENEIIQMKRKAA